MSRRMQGWPALAKCAAMRAPMVPAPRTAAFWIERVMRDLFEAVYEKEQVTKPVWRGQTREDANREIGVPRFVTIQEIRREPLARGARDGFKMVLRCQMEK